MIVVPIQLYSAVTGEVENLGTIVIDNIGGTRARGDYRVRAYAKGAAEAGFLHMVSRARPIREGRVFGHRRQAEPVGNLIAKAMKELGYG
ncbi:hypothetical protein [Sphingomonas sp. CCH15-F11]|uniref:hypothetical protein n=1 Tax=Sphingomonas sp. CCH15-F11 TaxID=1768785 RepID=UPI000831C910|nr:hypothetical protein [Sphingomonas sp. CCH15-F11]